MSTLQRAIPGGIASPRTLAWAALVLSIEALSVGAASLAFERVAVGNPAEIVYSFAWVNAAVFAVARTAPPPTERRRRLLAAGAAVAYLLALAYFGGLVSLAGRGTGFEVIPALPAWGPIPVYSGSPLFVALVPFKVVGYLGLAYLVYVTLLDAAGSALTGVVGLFSCVSCTWPILGTVATGLLGGALGGAALSYSSELSTLVFLSAVALLYWRPTASRAA